MIGKLGMVNDNQTHGNITDTVSLNIVDGSSDDMAKMVIICVFLVGLPSLFCCLYLFAYICGKPPPQQLMKNQQNQQLVMRYPSEVG